MRVEDFRVSHHVELFGEGEMARVEGVVDGRRVAMLLTLAEAEDTTYAKARLVRAAQELSDPA